MLLLILKEIKHRWLIYLLTVFLMAFIISILVIQSSINTSAEETINGLSHKLGKGMLVVPEGTDLERFYTMRYGDTYMPDDYGERIKASPLGKHASMIDPRLYGNIDINGTDIVLVGLTSTFPEPGKPNESFAAIGNAAASKLGIGAGDTLEIGKNTVQIFRVLDPPPKGYDMALFVPITTAQVILSKPGLINGLHMGGCWCEMDVAGFAAKVEDTLPGTMAITVDGMAKSQIEINETMERYSVVIWIVGSVLAIGTIFFLILYMIYKSEREIGLLLSIGLSPARIVIKNLVIAVITAISGAFIGYMLSFPLMSYFGKAFLRMTLTPTWEFFPHFMGAALVIGLVAATFPSWYVSRLDPTKLLREE
jgi:ABC-type antimicrobial peptide transport system permease subunit